MACSNRHYLLRELDNGYTLVITEEKCYTTAPNDPSVGTNYKFGQLTLLCILLDKLNYKWDVKHE